MASAAVTMTYMRDPAKPRTRNGSFLQSAGKSRSETRLEILIGDGLRNNQEICLVIKPVTARQWQRSRRSQQNPIPQRKTRNFEESVCFHARPAFRAVRAAGESLAR